MENLFVIYLGGSCKEAIIEVHDMRLVIAETIEDTYDTLKKNWWGDSKGLHLDAWGILRWADGYKIEIMDSVPENNQAKLYFVNLGGYSSKEFTELHKNIFIVAKNDREAKLRALKHIENWESPHRDNLFDVDKILNVSNFLNNRVRLTPCVKESPFEFICKYVPIDKF